MGIICRGYLLITFLLTLSCYGENRDRFLTVEQTAVLKQFLHVLFEDSEGGYVFWDKKPICIHGFECRDSFRVDTPFHRQSVALREGGRIWKRLYPEDSNIAIHISDKEEPNIPGYFHVKIVNKRQFIDCVNKNLILFQYVLGPEITAKKMLEGLLDENVPFHFLLKNDKVLIGIVLGFGVQNALYVGCIENLQENLEKDTPPFLPLRNNLNVMFNNYFPTPDCVFNVDKLEKLQQKVSLSSRQLLQKNPQFVFGWVSDSKESIQLIFELERAQKLIVSSLRKKNFLQKAMNKVGASNYQVSANKNFYFRLRPQINKIMAKGIWEFLQDYDSEYICCFVEDFGNVDTLECEIIRDAWFPDFLRRKDQAKKNLLQADLFFSELMIDESFRVIVPGKLGYRIVEKGIGVSKYCGGCPILSYSIFSPNGQCLVNAVDISINLNNTIVGFAHGVIGMKRNETREIFIHPSFAYGLQTSLEKCVYLRAIVTLSGYAEGINDSKSEFDFAPPVVQRDYAPKIAANDEKGSESATLETLDVTVWSKEPEKQRVQNRTRVNNDTLPVLHGIDFSTLFDKNTEHHDKENYKNALRQRARAISRHLKKCEEIDLEEIKKYLIKYCHGNDAETLTNQKEREYINQVHWNIYFGEK